MKYKAHFIVKEDEVNDVYLKLRKISSKDETFKFRISRRQSGNYRLTIIDKDIDQLHSRALWVLHNVFKGDRLYWVTKGKV